MKTLADLAGQVAGWLGGRRRLVWLAAGGLVAGVLLAAWLATPPSLPNEAAVEVEVALPPPSAPSQPQAPPASPAADPAATPLGPGNAVTVPPVAADAFAAIPAAPRARPLPPAPDPALVETAPEGALPRRGADGRLPWQAYARPFAVAEGRAPIAVIVNGLGSSAIVTGEIVRRLPADVTLAFEPAAANVAEWGRQARAAGHEILLGLPVQGGAFPFLDRGPDALAGDVAAAENRARLQRLLARLAGSVGALANVGAEAGTAGDAAAAAALELAGKELTERGLLLVGPLVAEASGGEVPRLGVDLSIGPDADAATARERLAELESIAAAKGHAVAIVEPTPAAAAALAAWAATLAGKPVVLAPVSAVARAVQARGR